MTLNHSVKSNGCKITKYYDDDSQLINDIKLKTSNLNVLSFGAFMKIILNCIDSAQSEKLNSLQYFQCWYNTLLLSKSIGRKNMDELITLLADLVIEESITLMTNNNTQHLIGVGLYLKFIHKYILSLWKEETG